ncbi:DNA topoisomerase 4 subunit A [Chitiniphilus shinanonensis]|uniref:DNA topoisomerase 4 subunit A n=1 Tax=Chitiniphilus shinanonensis TaxID=553088 RepID=A0ABQ6BT53_9NEIS|nr:DNA topoisomerase IV subunit A [Chitiniphilus shinanonensis]GLS02994.1 DNA topoisomerase 4 subunit A [Chitiniphilus shinanonensis]
MSDLDLPETPDAEVPAETGNNGNRRYINAQSSTLAPDDGESVQLGLYAEKSYLEYAMSVVKSRALPQVEDGQKPVQRRILYAMHELGLTATAKPVKSARIVGEVLGKFHPHGDQSAYDALVRIAQDFSLRYPLIDGQGNFGSRDGDGAAAMRYTEARLTPIAELLLGELDAGTTDFIPNYDGALEEPLLLPARLPLLLLNGTSGIAVGMATEIPSHNLGEVADAAIALIRNPGLDTGGLLQYVKGPDLPGGGQLISSARDIQSAYETGRGSLKVRARWEKEDLARGQWQIVVTELPQGTSSQRVLEEIEELTNPKLRKGKKALTQEQVQTKQLVLSQLDRVRDESGKDQPVRLVFEPKSSRQDPAELMTMLLAHTSLETNLPLNLVTIGRDGRPGQKSLRDLIAEWVDFRFVTVRRRTEHRLGKVNDRIHILEGRMVVFLNIDEVIRIIRESDEPKAALIARFQLSDRQAEDILEIRLRQLARLEGIKIEQELADLRTEKEGLENLLANVPAMQKLVIKEIEADRKKYGDPRRTLIEEAEKATLEVAVVDEPTTLILSEKGWVRSRQGHGVELQNLTFKDGDKLLAAIECRTVDSVALLGSDGRVYTIQASVVPGGRGDGVPVTTLVELAPKSRVVQLLVARSDEWVVIANSSGYGFACQFDNLLSRQKAGKSFITLEANETLLRVTTFVPRETSVVACLSKAGKLHLFPYAEFKQLAGGGRGVITMALDDKDQLAAITVSDGDTLRLTGTGRGGKPTELILDANEMAPYVGKRARKGKPINAGLKFPGF